MRQQVVTEIHGSRKERALQRQKQRRKKRMLCGLIAMMSILLALTSEQIYRVLAVLQAFETQPLQTSKLPPDTFGVLILGIDNDGGKLVDAGHTDSITYVGVNMSKKQAYALPIYRDTNIPLSCGEGTENINRIYAQKGIKCLAYSTSSFLHLPISQYVLVTMAGFVDIIAAFGSITLTPNETFCSNYGMNRKVSYCFHAGRQQQMQAEEALAFSRYRASGNGEARANRQMQIMLAVKNQCLANVLNCYDKIAPHLAKTVKTNFSPYEVLQLLTAMGPEFDVEMLEVIRGENIQKSPGNWSLYADDVDKQEKTTTIRERVFTKEMGNQQRERE